MQDEKILNNCLMDSDREVRIRATHRRRRATVIALSAEAALVVGLALWPIVTTGSPPTEIVMLPRIPYRGSDAPKPETAQPRTQSVQPQQVHAILLHLSQRIPVRIDGASSAKTQSVAVPAIPGSDLWDTGQTFGVATGTGNDASMIPPPRPLSPRIIQQSEGVQSGLLVYRVDPRYPRLAMNAGVSGTVELRAIIGRDGRVRSVEVLSGSALLAPAAVAAVREWRYKPTLLNGEAVEVETHVTVHFVFGQ